MAARSRTFILRSLWPLHISYPQPYYRCHSGDSYEVFGAYHIFSEPLRIPADISYTDLVQDIWTAFVRTGAENSDLAAQGPAYQSMLRLLQDTKWVWPNTMKCQCR
ncbi:hypothetical protein GGU11DRAFT_788903 [Lentinula aff. detonsa]|nr:hypothetical protein GGU11DRAFT_788903 [Lentinula aff. detonsa]